MHVLGGWRGSCIGGLEGVCIYNWGGWRGVCIIGGLEGVCVYC